MTDPRGILSNMEPSYAIDEKKLKGQSAVLGHVEPIPIKDALAWVASLRRQAPHGLSSVDETAVGRFLATPTEAHGLTDAQLDAVWAVITHTNDFKPPFSLFGAWRGAEGLAALVLGHGRFRFEPAIEAPRGTLRAGGSSPRTWVTQQGLTFALELEPGAREAVHQLARKSPLPPAHQSACASFFDDAAWGNEVIDGILASGATDLDITDFGQLLGTTNDGARMTSLLSAFGRYRPWVATSARLSRAVRHLSAPALLAVMLPVLERAQTEKWKSSQVEPYFKVLFHIRSPEAATAFASWMGEKSVAKLAGDYFRKHPDLAPALQGVSKGKAKIAAQGLLASLARSSAEAPTAKTRKGAKTSKGASTSPASSALPAVLVRPPWLDKKRSRSTLVLEPIVEGEQFILDPRVKLHAPEPDRSAENDRKLIKGRPLEQLWGQQIFALTDETALKVLACSRSMYAFDSYFAWLGERTVPTTIARIAASIEACSGYLRRAVSPRLALPCARAVRKRATHKAAREACQRWLRAHPYPAALGLLPAALGQDALDADAAEGVLRELVRDGHTQEVNRAVARYGAEAEQAFAALLARSPYDRVPAKMPLKAKWAAAERLTPLELTSGGVLSPEHVLHFLQMLQISSLGDPYVGVTDTLALLTEACRAPFASALLDEYALAGSSPAHEWVIGAVALIAPSVAIARLGKAMRAWAADGKVPLLHRSLEALAEIGSDEALVVVYDAGQRSRYDDTRDKVRDILEAVADARALSYEQLEDRLVPELGLEHGEVVLPLGARSVRVRLGEHLEAVLRDDAGEALASFPRKLKADDAERYAEAKASYAALIEAAETVGKGQILRFERALRDQRRWTVADLREHVLPQPLVRHLASRVVWQVVESGQLFRVAEDLTFADATDTVLPAPPADARVVLAHPLLAPELAAFGTWIADYQVIQPFAQVGREVFSPSAAESTSGVVTRAEGRKVSYLSVLALTLGMGWKPIAPTEKGINAIVKELPGERIARIGISPGLLFGAAKGRPEQTVGRLSVESSERKPASFEGLEPLLASELLRDLMALG